MGFIKSIKRAVGLRKARRAASGKRLAYSKKDRKRIKAFYAGKR